MNTRAELVVVGGGIIGLAIAYRFTLRHPGQRVVILEKERAVAGHQSGHNSGVLHSGVYYRPGSLKARFCRAGKQAMEALCSEAGIPFRRCGKVVVAVSEREVERLRALAQRARDNGVSCALVDARELRSIEPHASGVEALHVPDTGVVDFREVCQHLRERVVQGGGAVEVGARVTGIEPNATSTRVVTTAGTVDTHRLVNAAGLQVDRVAKLAGAEPSVRIIPFRGEFYRLREPSLCRALIYPVPDPELPFLGVHVSRRIDGTVECGPNAVLAFAREGYRARDVRWGELWSTLTYPGFVRMAMANVGTGAQEMWRSLNSAAFAKEVQRLVPNAHRELLVRSGSGVRAQAITRDGTLVDDFLIEWGPRMVHVLNAPSPAATASLAVADAVVDELEKSD